MSPDHGAQETPRACSPVHSKHAQDLKEAQTSERGRCEIFVLILAARDHCERYARNYHCQVLEYDTNRADFIITRSKLRGFRSKMKKKFSSLPRIQNTFFMNLSRPFHV